MTPAYKSDQPKSKRKKVIFNLFIFTVIEWLLIVYYFIISGLTGGLKWTITRLTTTIEGFIIQIFQLATLILGFIIFLQVVIYITLVLKGIE